MLGTFKHISVNPFTLHFSGDIKHFEKDYQKDYLENSVKHIRVALILGFSLYAGFGILDAFLIPEQKHLMWMVRYALVCPSILITLLLLKFKLFQKNLQPLLSLLVVISGAGIIIMILIAPPPVNYSYYAGLILIFFFGYTFIRLRFIWASFGAWVVVIMYEIAAIGTQTPLPILINNNFFFISANLIGMIACYSMELYNRHSYYLSRQLIEEQKKIKSINRLLETKVAERTRSLVELNEKLEKEIQVRKETQEAIIQASKMVSIGQLAAGMAHEINNPLAVIMQNAQVISNRLSKTLPASMKKAEELGLSMETIHQFMDQRNIFRQLESIHTAGLRAAKIIENMLSFSKKSDADKQFNDLETLIKDSLELARTDYSLKYEYDFQNLKIHLDLSPDLPEVFCEASRIQQVLFNITKNAVEHMYLDSESDTKPELYISLEKEHDYAQVVIKDNGPGMDSEICKKIFDPFFTTKDLSSGTGLGLFVSYYIIVDDHKGTIDVESETGKGTQFIIRLPLTVS